ncbi:isoleucine--tRNA ligase [Crocinitomix catalasitica]|uniref:isoleucine--tRNA ligase n=1 Tax=Crocinitomix catalasitica TaxID=184607 RepID=UPI0004876181|nr:isoleucine--tRNA ligase [Crocinitomix catalasitica]
MSKKYPEYKGLNLPNIANLVLEDWESNQIFKKSVDTREGNPPFIFTEGPPSANGMPGIHHVMARSIKDIFCRYKTLKGFQVKRKAGWDTHGLPVELKVEKELGITKEDIGTKISVEDYNKACREAVLRYTDEWNKLTQKIGYWVNMDDPYITYESKYMETVWWLLGQFYAKNLLYKGYTIQPYSPKAGTGLSSHEINQPGAYQDVKDTTCVAQFKVKAGEKVPFKNANIDKMYFMAWTTTPWTLPSNTALTVGPNIDYVLVKSFNQYTFDPIEVVLAKNLVGKQFNKKYKPVDASEDLDYTAGDKTIPYQIIGECKGEDLIGIRYDQLLDYTLPFENADKAFVIIGGDFVTTEDGTGIVHTAPTFGADDALVAKAAGVPPMLILDENGQGVPLVDLQGRFRKEVSDPIFGFAGEYVKAEYLEGDDEANELKIQRENLKDIIADLKGYMSVDERITLKLKIENKAFKIEKYEHSYPHCWRTDKPILYYPLDSWFVKVADNREKLVALNKTINWQPKATGEGRFGNWLENANDWNLSRSRYWGIPIPIWTSEDKTEQICISSIEQLKAEADKAVVAGVMDKNPLADFEVGDMSKENYDQVDLHKNYVDEITLVSATGQPLKREADLIDVWFDSGSVPYAQHHYPFENKELIDSRKGFPSDFIAEGVDQTRGWFYTQHVIAGLIFDSVAYKNVMSNGLVQDKNGHKMSKSKGNAVEPFEILEKYGPDATRWYMVTNAQPWDNLKFDEEGITEVQRKFFGTLYNTYSFFSLYANIDNFNFKEDEISIEKRPEIDRWILSKLNTLIQTVDEAFEAYEPTKAGRQIQLFVTDELSNWYVRLCRRRFWKGDYSTDKISAYQTLYRCLETVAILSAPIAPFFMDKLFQDLNSVSGRFDVESVHLTDFPVANTKEIDLDLEEKMSIAQKISSMVLSLRKGKQIKVRQPLQRIMVPILNEDFARRLEDVKDIILSETNIKEIELLKDTEGVLIKKIKPNFKTIGPKYGKQMKAIAGLVNQWTGADISAVEQNDGWKGELNGEVIELVLEDFEISTDDIPGWLVSSEGKITVALDITLSDELKSEGIARELVSRVQNYRKESGLEVMDKINLSFQTNDSIKAAIESNADYICEEVLAEGIDFTTLKAEENILADLEEGDVIIRLVKV